MDISITQKIKKIISYINLFNLLIFMILISGCNSGSVINNISSNSNFPLVPTNLPIESIVLVSPTESGSIDLVTGYPQKILVAGIDKKGTRKL
ncbi:MAG: hypothetical protein ACK5XF_07990, partial [Neisseriaceae bacterium]